MKWLYKDKQVKWIDRGIIKMFMPSLIGIVVCVTCLLGTTFAWFTDHVSTAAQSIISGNYDVKIKITDSNGTTVNPDNNGAYILSQKEMDRGYIVSITAIGTTSTGFCKINDSMVTEQINPGTTTTFTLYPDENNKAYTFSAMWGTFSNNANKIKSVDIIKDGDIVGTPLEINDGSDTSETEEIDSMTPSEEKEDDDSMEDNKIETENNDPNTLESEGTESMTPSEGEEANDSNDSMEDNKIETENTDKNTSESEGTESMPPSEEEVNDSMEDNKIDTENTDQNTSESEGTESMTPSEGEEVNDSMEDNKIDTENTDQNTSESEGTESMTPSEGEEG